MCEALGSAGYEHYEVSNFAKHGYRSQHNQLYWQGVPYLGIGPGAHSYNGQARRFNVSNNPAYLKALKKGVVPSESEVLNAVQEYNEYLLTRLRTNSGIDLMHIRQKYKIDLAVQKQEYFRQCIDKKLAYFERDNFVLTEKGFFVSDAIILELMK